MATSCELRNGTSECVKLRLDDCKLISKVRYLIIGALTLMDSVRTDTLGFGNILVMWVRNFLFLSRLKKPKRS